MLKELIDKNGDKPLAYMAYKLLLKSYAKEAPKDEDARGLAEQVRQSRRPLWPRGGASCA